MGLIALGHVILALPFVFVLPLPGSAAVPFIIASTVIHWAYYYFLVSAYRFGDLSFAYPIARGVSPVLVAVAAFAFQGETLNGLSWIGVIVVSSGIMLLALSRTIQNRGKALGFALLTAVTIAAYTLADGTGIRVSANIFSYVAWLFLAESIVAAFVLGPKMSQPGSLKLHKIWPGILGGVISGLAYALALIAMTMAPLGSVSAVRETSVVFATLLGVIWFKERPIALRLGASAIVAIGVATITLA